MLSYNAGLVDGHVETHGSPGRPQNYGRDEESDWVRSARVGQLHRSYAGTLYCSILVAVFKRLTLL